MAKHLRKPAALWNERYYRPMRFTIMVLKNERSTHNAMEKFAPGRPRG
jgi:hypothetical protein